MVVVRPGSSSFTFRIEELKRRRTGLAKETLTYFSLESASVNSVRGRGVMVLVAAEYNWLWGATSSHHQRKKTREIK